MKVFNAGVSAQEVAQKILPEAEQILKSIENGLIKELGVVEVWHEENVKWLRNPDGRPVGS
jgi:hypothetical protein